MPDISLTRQSQLIGRPLQDAVANMVHDLSGRSPYSLVRLGWRWVTGAQIALDAPGHVSGTIDIRDGNPSTVTVRINLLSSTAQNYRSRLIQDMNAEADRFLAGSQPTVSAPAATASTSSAAAASTAATSSTTRQRGEFNWNLFGQIFTNVATGVASNINAMNEAFAQTTAEQALEAASEAKQVFDGGVLYTTPIDVTAQSAASPSSSAPSPVLAQAGMPTWGWWALGIGGVAVFGFVVWRIVRR